MPTTQVQFRRGTTTQNDAFTGAIAEITVDTTLDTIRVHDGVTAGGFASVNTTAVQTLTNKTISSGTLVGNTTITGNLLPSSNVLYNMGSTTSWWNMFYGRSVQAQYADLAENYAADAVYKPGTVVVFGGEKEITVATNSYDSRVAGVVSTNPAYLMNAASGDVAIALTGRVPCQVRGPVKKGDVLTTSSVPGVAMVLDPAKFVPGCVLGKCLEEIADSSTKTIEVVVGRF